MRQLIGALFCLSALTMFSRPSPAAGANLVATGTPAGFTDLATPRVVLVDVYVSGRKVAEALATSSPGTLRFRSPEELLSKIPDVIITPAIRTALASDLPTNSGQRCTPSNGNECGLIKPDVAGIIYDDDHFRVDLFINPRFLRSTPSAPTGYLPAPEPSLSLTSAFGFSASGTLGRASAYNIQDQTIVGLGEARLRANLSLASSTGLIADDLVAEVDRKDLRYSAGLFWARGNDFTGERRIIGAGFGTQFDTWADEQTLHSTTLIVFLPEPARVDLLVDGRLVSSRAYPGGNIELDTSPLPQGSYSLVVRIHHPNGSIEDLRRFFVKDPEAPPRGHPIYYGYAGLLANTRADQPISASKTLYYEAGTARRLNDALALDASISGTQRKAMVEAGAWLLEGPARVRAAGLVSTAGDRAALLQLTAGGHGRFTLSMDLRRVWSADGEPLVPLPTYVEGFDVTPPTGAQLATGSYTQAVGSIGLQLGRGFLSLVGSYRRDRDLGTDYAVGPSINYPLITHNQIQVVFEGSAQRSEHATAAFAGLRVQLSSGRLGVLGTLGHGSQSGGSGDQAQSRVVGSIAADYSRAGADQLLVSAEAGADRNIDSSTIHATGIVDSRLGSFRADLLHNLEGERNTQYDVSFQSGLALGKKGAAIGSREIDQSAILVSLGGDARDALFNVLVDDVPRGQVKPGERLSLFVPAYRRYRVRLVPAVPAAVAYDTAERDITLYPGNVRNLGWTAQSFFTLFGQAVSADGRPLSNALVESAKGIAETDGNGYFQIDVRRADPITISRPGALACHVRLGAVTVRNDFASVGKVICE